jgi:hypothetical protein
MQNDPTTPPVGLSTRVGLAVAALLGVLGPLSTVLDGDQTPEAIGALVSAAIVLYGVIRSRGEQAAALAHARFDTRRR